MGAATISGTRPERDFGWLSDYLQSARSHHADFVRQVERASLLFHYTDLNGLKGIATEHDLWLTTQEGLPGEARRRLERPASGRRLHLLLLRQR